MLLVLLLLLLPPRGTSPSRPTRRGGEAWIQGHRSAVHPTGSPRFPSAGTRWQRPCEKRRRRRHLPWDWVWGERRSRGARGARGAASRRAGRASSSTAPRSRRPCPRRDCPPRSTEAAWKAVPGLGLGLAIAAAGRWPGNKLSAGPEESCTRPRRTLPLGSLVPTSRRWTIGRRIAWLGVGPGPGPGLGLVDAGRKVGSSRRPELVAASGCIALQHAAPSWKQPLADSRPPETTRLGPGRRQGHERRATRG